MADSKNYKVNLITDIEDLLKGNNELRATSRYIDSVKRATEQFSRARYQGLIKVNTELKYMQRHLSNIYSLAVRVSRLRIIPTVYLIDYATPALERLLKKLKEVNSYAVVARANIHFKMQASMTPMMPATSVVTQVDTTTTTTIEGLNIDGLISALINNTTAVSSLSTKLDSVTTGTDGSKEEPKGLIDSIIDLGGGIKSVGEGAKSVGEAPDAWKGFKNAVSEFKNPGGSKAMKIMNVIKTGGTLFEVGGTAIEGLTGGIKDIIENGTGIWNSITGSGDAASAATSAATASSNAAGDVASGSLSTAGRVAADAATSNVFKGSLKAFSKSLGPLSLLPDAFSFATADNNEQRGAAIGSAVVGIGATALGTALGSFLPVVGNVALGAAFGIAGNWLGDKFGGMIGKNFDSPAIPNPSSVTKDTTGNNTMFIPDLSNLTGIPFPPNKNMLAPKPSFADRYVTPVWENNIKPRVNNPAPSVPPQPKANEVANKARITTTTKTSVQSTVQLSDTQMGTLSGMLKDFKAQVTNNVSVNVPAGAVQVTVKENKIDYDALAIKVGQRVIKQVRQALENQKPASASGTATPAS